MSKVICIKYGWKEFNSNGEKWDALEKIEYSINSDVVINALYERFGDRLWNSIENINNKTMVISLADFEKTPSIELEVTIIEE